MSSTERPSAQSTLEQWLAEQIAGYIGTEAGEIHPEADFGDYGLESVSAFVLCGDIETHLGLTVEPTVTWDYPTVRALATHLRGELEQRVPDAVESAAGADS